MASPPDENDFALFVASRNMISRVKLAGMRNALGVLFGRERLHESDIAIIDSGLRLATFYRLAFFEARARVFELAPSEPWVPLLSLKAASPSIANEVAETPVGFPPSASACDILSVVANLAGIDPNTTGPLESGAIILWNETRDKLAMIKISGRGSGFLNCAVDVLSIADGGVMIEYSFDRFEIKPKSLDKEGASSDAEIDVVKTSEQRYDNVYKELWVAASHFAPGPKGQYDPEIAQTLLDTGTFSPF